MEVFLARQPIFDRKMRTYGYELLYRKSEENSFSGGMDDDQATEELIRNSVLIMGLDDLTGGAKAFMNFSKRLLGSKIPLLLPPKRIVIEILERGAPTQALMEACVNLHSKGYTIALDDFVMDDSFLMLLDYVDLVKVDYPFVKLEDQRRLLARYKGRLKFLAEKVETREDYKITYEMGYDYFQGYFFCRPAMMNAKEIVSFDGNILRILEELNRLEPDYNVISDLISHDMGLSFKLLKLANSVALGAGSPIRSIRQAVSYLGIRELFQWISLIMIRDIKNEENAEMINMSVIRARWMELLAIEIHHQGQKSEYFLAGMFANIDVLTNRKMEEVVKGLPLSDDTKLALLGGENELGKILKCISGVEKTGWSTEKTGILSHCVDMEKMTDLYLQALRWTKNVALA